MPTVNPSKHPPSLFPPPPCKSSTVPSPPPWPPPLSFFFVAVGDTALLATVEVLITMSVVEGARRSVGCATSVVIESKLSRMEVLIGEEESRQASCRGVKEAEAAGHFEAMQVRREERCEEADEQTPVELVSLGGDLVSDDGCTRVREGETGRTVPVCVCTARISGFETILPALRKFVDGLR